MTKLIFNGGGSTGYLLTKSNAPLVMMGGAD